MPLKKTPEVDNEILMALALGESNKSIAERLHVSTSYVSKVKTGKKVLSCKIAEPSLITDGLLNIQDKDIQDVLIFLNSKETITNKEAVIIYIENKMKQYLVNAKICQIILNNMKGDKNDR